MKYITIFLLLATFSFYGQAQILEPSKWSTELGQLEVSVGEEVELIFKATINKDWYLYSSDFDPDCGPVVTTFHFTPDASYELVGDIKAIKPKEKFDEVFECNVKIFKEHGEFRQTIKVLSADPQIRGNYEFQVCSEIDGKCILFDNDFDFSQLKVTGGEESTPAKVIKKNDGDQELSKTEPAKEESKKKEDTSVTQKAKVDYSNVVNQGPILDPELIVKDPREENILWFMLFAFVAGLTALLTPCVFPMIPMTVSYFTGNGGKKSKAFIYGFSIVAIYSLIGAALAPLMGPETANHLSTEWLPNIIFFLVFIIFSLSFFGMFDITLPSGFVNKMDAKSDKGGLIGVFFMAFTLVLVSFSCTGPIAGSILVMSAGGEILKPILGMFAFGMAFAIPFTLFAVFPRWLDNLPKSGGWLNSVKVVLGFIELALAFKFLSIADQAFHWGILDRDINIAIWIGIFSVMGLYLLGKVRLPHDSPLEFIGVPRLLLAITTFIFVIYLIPGMWGAPLKALAGYLPPMHTHDFDLVKLNRTSNGNEICDEPIYSDFLHLPHGLNGYFDYDQAIACARAQNKPLFIDFTGHGCTNCREMEATVWAEPEVLSRLQNDYVVVALYVDDKTELPEEKWYTSTYDNKVKKTIGKQNADLQIKNLENNAQPFYILVGADEKVLVSPIAREKNVANFVKFLDAGKKKYKELYLE